MRIFSPQKFRLLFIFTISVLLSFQGFCLTITSTATGGNWSSPATWVGGVVPGINDDVVIVADASVVVNVNANCASLYLSKDKNTLSLSFEITGTNTFSVFGNIVIDGNSPTTTLSLGNGILNVGGDLHLISPPGEADLTLAGGIINVSGDLKLTNGSGDGSGIGAGKVRDINGTGTIYLGGVKLGTGDISPTVNIIQSYSGSLPLDYFRSNISSGNWGNLVSWQSSHNGNDNWNNATTIPNASSKRIVVRSGHLISLDNIVPASNLIVNNGGLLNCSTFQITGPGPFDLEAGATIVTKHTDGLGAAGSIQVSGTKTFGSLANYEFQGESTGIFSTSTPYTCNNVTINNASGVNLSSPLTVNGLLSITGKFLIGSNILTLNGGISGTNATNGLVGSVNSDLVIGGGPVNLTLGFNQANAAARTINNFTQSRNSLVTLTDSLQTNGLLTLSGTDSKLASGANAYLRLISTATSFANVAPLLNNTDITGNVKVEAWLTGDDISRRHTRMMSPPVNDNLTLTGNKIYQQLKKYLIVTGSGGVANGFDPGNASQPNAITLTRYLESNNLSQSQFAFVPSLTNGVVPMIKPGEGFFLFFRGNRSGYMPATSFTSNKVNPPFLVPESFAITYTGELNKKNISVTLSKAGYAVGVDSNDGYNVIGNPYSATIDFSSLYNSNSTVFENYYMVSKPDKTGTMSFSLAGGGTLVNPGGSMATVAIARYIQPGQAFYIVKKNTGINTYPAFFTESMKATGSSPARLLSVPIGKTLLANSSMSLTPMVSKTDNHWPLLRMSLQDNFNTDEAVVIFSEGYQKVSEGSDVPYFSGSTVSLSTLSDDGKSLAINLMPDLSDVTEIRLNLNSSASGPLKLNFTDISATMGFQLLLRDNYISQTSLIEIKPNTVYELVIDKTVADSYGAGRLVLVIKPKDRMPLKLLRFTASAENNSTLLSWSLQNEMKKEHFEVERSSDNVSFLKIGEVMPNIPTSSLDYSLTDRSPLSGNNYYRLKEILLNGEINISESVWVNIDSLVTSPDNLIHVYPNPAKSEIFVKIGSNCKRDVIMSIFDLQGKRHQKIKFLKNSIIKSDISLFKEGLYLLEIRNSLNNRLIGNVKFYKN